MFYTAIHHSILLIGTIITAWSIGITIYFLSLSFLKRIQNNK